MKRWFPAVAALLVTCVYPTLPAVAQYAEPSAAPPAATTESYIVVTAPEADVLADPREGAAVVLKVLKGDLLPLRGQAGEWYSVGAGEGAAGWIRRSSSALLMHPEFLDPVRLRESYTPPPYVSPRAYGYPWSGYRRVPYPWQDPLWWGLWYYDQKHDDDDDDDHDHHGGHNGHNDDDHDGGRNRDRDRDRDRDRSPRPGQPIPPPPRDPRTR